jgi:hypothetical protein
MPAAGEAATVFVRELTHTLRKHHRGRVSYLRDYGRTKAPAPTPMRGPAVAFAFADVATAMDGIPVSCPAHRSIGGTRQEIPPGKAALLPHLSP